MNILKKIIYNFFTPQKELKSVSKISGFSSSSGYTSYSSNGSSMWFNGEKTPYTLGSPVQIQLDYMSLAYHSWEKFIKTDIIQNGIKKYILWVVGSGLKLQYSPIVSEDKVQLAVEIEEQFRLYANIKESTINGMQNLHVLIVDIIRTAKLSGDALIIMRLIGGMPRVQAIDGIYIQTPYNTTYISDAEKRGNRIIKGVEVNNVGTHIAFYIKKDDGTYQRILARGVKTGRLTSWLFYGQKFKLSDVRGVPAPVAVLETTESLSNYKDAVLASAQEVSKIPYTFRHEAYSDGTNPMTSGFLQSMGKGKGSAPETDPGGELEKIAYKIAQTTNKQVFNLPLGAKFEPNSYKADSNFDSFYNPNAGAVYTALGIAPEVAMETYNGSYSGSRATIKGFEYKLNVDRKNDISDLIYSPIFEFWLDISVLSGVFDFPEYLKALFEKDIMKLAALRRARFIGAAVPHIDPLKEVKAEREKLGAKFKDVPLTTAEQSTESLSSLDFNNVIEKTEKELIRAEKFTEDEL